MKRSNDEVFFEETKRKEIKLTTCQVMIKLDETIGSRLLHHKFKYLTSELQLFLQHVPVLYWYPLEIIGTTNYDTLDTYLFNAVMRNQFHGYSNCDIVESMSKLNLSAKLNSYIELFIFRALEEYHVDEHKKNPLKYISNQLKDDEKFMLKAIEICGRNALEYASDRVKNSLEDSITRPLKEIENPQSSEVFDREGRVMLKQVKRMGTFLSFASDSLKDNEHIVLEAVKQSGHALKYASERLQDHEQFVLQSIKQDSSALRFVSDRLKDNEQVVLEAVKNNAISLEYASDRLKDNEIIVLEAVKKMEMHLNMHQTD